MESVVLSFTSQFLTFFAACIRSCTFVMVPHHLCIKTIGFQISYSVDCLTRYCGLYVRSYFSITLYFEEKMNIYTQKNTNLYF